MKFSFQDLIREIEGVKNYLLEDINNLSFTKKVMNLLELNEFDARILCYIFYFQMVKSQKFEHVILKKMVDVRDQRYLEFLRAIERLFLKNFVLLKSENDFWGYREKVNVIFFQSAFLGKEVFNFFITGEKPLFNKELIDSPEQLGSIVTDKYNRFREIVKSVNDLELHLESEIMSIKNRISDSFPLAKVVKELPSIELIFLGLLFENFSYEFSYRFSAKMLDSSFIDRWLRRNFFNEKGLSKRMLYKHRLIEREKMQTMTGTVILLTEKALKVFFDYEIKDLVSLSFLGIESKIKSKELFFNKEVERYVREIEFILHNKKYRRFCSLSRKHGLSPSISVLVYGEPGTGKTEFVYQVARKTGRKVLKVDVSKIISKWVGESEKNVRAIFNEYRKALLCFKKHPILLLNEADVFLSERVDVNNSIDQSHNDIRNIFLEELENFEGIVFATTNLVDGIDNAFYRRFGFKLYFGLPDKEVRKKIWKSKKPDLNDEILEILANYPLTGGEIDNVFKGLMVASVLSEDRKKEDILIELAKSEVDFKGINLESSKLGFRVG